ncbi:MAG: undecaprenyl/decaprenyl-phosphate alpha-N-acetylglucosaminyl 1-phosphate transferase, partial [Candidatus Latescibacteria bacterium]|nr:undecaprenyl/decaprenyl-phosphate alpha-N-acetylglucosaminyl 1-phosphate transferase [Candidatus Latescibacterota bacterium]
FVCRLASLLHVVDIPNERKMHKDATPLMGGLAIYIAFGTGVVSTLWYSLELKGVVYAATIIFVLGLLDDIFGLSSVIRLVVQLAAVFVLFYHGIEIDFIPDNTQYHIFEKIVTAIWILGITNAVNFLDGLDGLCVGFGAIASLIFGIIAFLTKQYFLMFLAFSLAGSCFGFLPWNFRSKKPAKIFLGDAGSLFIGFTLASFAVMGEWAENDVTALTVPILILFLPIYDTVMTTFFRIREGKVKTVRQWLDYVGKDHFHHRLFAMGIGAKNAVWILYLVTILLGFSAIMIRAGGRLEAYLALSQACIVMMFTTAFIVSIRKRIDGIENDCS